jgi:biopolymer transport protein ExbD
MAKAKIGKKSTFIDMAPMVDLAFLLITFFMLTVKFRPQESIEVKIPSSIADTPVPSSDIMTISISNDGRVFFAVDSKNTRERLMVGIARRFNLEFTKEQAETFALQADVGVPAEYLTQWLDLTPEQRKLPQNSPGIPVDSTKNQLLVWIENARISNPKLRIAVKADENTPYPVVQKVMATLQEKNIDKFNLITSAEAAAQ